MHLFCVIDRVARINFMAVPGWLAFNTPLQSKIWERVSGEFKAQKGQEPTDSEEDLDNLDNIFIEHIEDLVPMHGIRKVFEAVVRVSPTDEPPVDSNDHLLQ